MSSCLFFTADAQHSSADRADHQRSISSDELGEVDSEREQSSSPLPKAQRHTAERTYSLSDSETDTAKPRAELALPQATRAMRQRSLIAHHISAMDEQQGQAPPLSWIVASKTKSSAFRDAEQTQSARVVGKLGKNYFQNRQTADMVLNPHDTFIGHQSNMMAQTMPPADQMFTPAVVSHSSTTFASLQTSVADSPLPEFDPVAAARSLLNDLRNAQSDPEEQLRVLSEVSSLGNSADARLKGMWGATLIEYLITTLRNDPIARVAEQGCRALATLVSNHAGNKVLAGSVGACEVVLEILQRYPLAVRGNPSTRRASCSSSPVITV